MEKRELIIYVIKRSIFAILITLGVILLVFLISFGLNPHPAALWAGPKAKPSTIHYVILRYHLNDPLYVQLYYFFVGFFSGNIGLDPVTGKPIMSEILYYFPNTLELVLAALIIIVIFGVALGYVAAINFASKKDAFIRILYTAAWASPMFLVSILAVLIFTSYIPIFPSGGMCSPSAIPPSRITGIYVLDSLMNLNIGDFLDGMYHLALPALSLAFLNFGLITRMARTGILNAKWMPYVKTARAKGLDEKDVTRKHVLRNGLIQTNTVTAVMFSWLITGTIVVEEIFSWPGIGKFSYLAITSDNYPVLVYMVIMFTVFVVIANLIADIMYVVLDPRIALGGGE